MAIVFKRVLFEKVKTLGEVFILGSIEVVSLEVLQVPIVDSLGAKDPV